MPREVGTIATTEMILKRHAVLTYFALVFVISWGGVFLVVGPSGLPLRSDEFARLGGLLYAATFAGPCLAGLLLTGLIDGRTGIRSLVARLGHWRVGAAWYGLALLLPVAVIAAAQWLVAMVIPASEVAAPVDATGSPGVAGVLALSLMVGVCEEIGWTGFAVPRLLSRHSILASGLAIGVVWGAWHFPLFLEPDTFSGMLPFGILMARLFSWLPPFRVVMIWIYDRTGSVLVVILMHASLVATQLILFPSTETGVALLTGVLALAFTTWLLVSVMAATTRHG